MNTVDWNSFNTFHEQGGCPPAEHPQVLAATGDYEGPYTSEELDQLLRKPENTPWLAERSAFVVNGVEATFREPIPANEVSDDQASCSSHSNGGTWDELSSEMERFNPPADELAEMVRQLEKVIADKSPCDLLSGQGTCYGQAMTSSQLQSAEAVTDLSPPDQLPEEPASEPGQSAEPVPLKHGKCRPRSDSRSGTPESSYCLRSPRILKGMLKDGKRALYRSLMAMLKDSERHGDAVVWIDKTTGLFAIIDNCACTERLTRLRGYSSVFRKDACYSLRTYQKSDGSGILLPSRLVRTGQYTDMNNIFQWNLANAKVMELMASV